MHSSQYLLKRAAAFCAAALLVMATSAFAIPQRGQYAPAFKTFAISGQPLSTEGVKGSVVILDFWATWCPPCRESIPFLADLYRKYSKQGLQIIGMNVDEGSEQTVRSFVDQKRIPYPVVLASAKIQADYGVRALPVMFVIDRNGVVVEQMIGFSSYHGRLLENLVKKQLAGTGR